MAEVVLEKVGKTYPGGVQAVQDCSLHIADGEFVVLVGPSGCGKTTTLRMIAGLEEITSGQIRIGSQIVNDLHPRDRDIAMVFQNYALYPHMTVRQNMSFGLKMRKTPKAEIASRVLHAARILGIEELLDRRPRELSGGQRQRAAVGRAIVREPKAFLFDEPLSNLDAKLRIVTRGELKALHQRLKTTTVYVTHDQEEAMTLGDRIVVMSAGRVQQVGPPLEVYRRPVNRFVASFIGMPPMNFIDGMLQTENGTLSFVEQGVGGCRLPLEPAQADAAAAYSGKPVTLGLRPHSFRLAPGSSAGSATLAVNLQIVEPLGDSVDVTCTTAAGNRILARISASEQVGAELRFLGVEMAAAHLFEPGAGGRAIF